MEPAQEQGEHRGDEGVRQECTLGGEDPAPADTKESHPHDAQPPQHAMHLHMENSGKLFPCCVTFCHDAASACPPLPSTIREAIQGATLIHATWWVTSHGQGRVFITTLTAPSPSHGASRHILHGAVQAKERCIANPLCREVACSWYVKEST